MPVTADTLAFLVDEAPVRANDTKKKGREVSEDGAQTRSRWYGQSMYPKFLKVLTDTVMDHESFLLSRHEQHILKQLDDLSYDARFLLIRLVLRTRSKLHRLTDLQEKYGHELEITVKDCIEKLCTRIAPPADEEDPIGSEPVAGPCPKEDKPEYPDPVFRSFAEDETVASTREMLKSLKWDEIKQLGVKLKVFQNGMTRDTMIDAMTKSASKQSLLSFPVKPRTPGDTPKKEPLGSKSNCIDLTGPPLLKPGDNQMSRLREMIITVEPKFVQICEEVYTLIRRLNMIYFRCTSMQSNSILLPLILSQTRKRNYPEYTATRTADIFPTRDALLQYEAALRIEDEIDEVLEGLKGLERAEKVIELSQDAMKRWSELVVEATEAGEDSRPGLERFEEGHVLTRVMYKVVEALGQLKRHDEECQLLRDLLSQKRWRKGKRGVWYERLALVLMAHKKEPKNAMKVVLEGLDDPLTHIVCRPPLEKRLARLEKRLKVKPENQYVSDAPLRECKKITVHGIKLPFRATKSPSADADIRTMLSETPIAGKLLAEAIEASTGQAPVGRHSVWAGRNGTEVGVEDFALQHYETLGYRGFHSEGRILHHLFVLLFWSVLFMPVPGSFETAYQVAPLDLGHDSFYHSRAEAIAGRLGEIEDGKAAALIERVDDLERPKKTFAIGAKWDMFTKEDMVELVECMSPKALAVICRVICEGYSQRSSGVPDLLVWNVTQKTAMFVEVKGPGDRLSSTQEVWIDVILRAGMDVEVCLVRQHGHVEDKKPSKKKQKSAQSEFATPRNTSAAAESIVMDVDHEVIVVHGSDSEDDGPAPQATHPRKRSRSESTASAVPTKRRTPVKLHRGVQLIISD